MNNKILILLSALLMCFSTAIAQVTVSGTVVDESDFALPGASVIVKGEKGAWLPTSTVNSPSRCLMKTVS